MKTKITELEAQVAALTKDRDEALAKCGEMRCILGSMFTANQQSYLCPYAAWEQAVRLSLRALSTECGKGWRSPEQVKELVKPMVESLQWVLDVADEIDDETGHQSRHIQAALDHAKKQGWI